MKIPIKPPDATITGEAPSALMPIEAGGAVGRAIAQAGQGLEKVSERYVYLQQALEEKQNEARDTIQKATAQTALKIGADNILSKYKNDPNYQNFEDTLPQDLENLKSTIPPSENPIQQRLLDEEFKQHASTIAVHVRGFALQARQEKMKENFLGYIVPNAKRMIEEAPTPEAAQETAQWFTDIASDLTRPGLLSAEQAANSLITVIHGGELQAAKNLAAQAPNVIIGMNESAFKTRFKNLSTDDYIDVSKISTAYMRTHEETMNKRVRDVQKTNEDMATDLVFSPTFVVNGQEIVVSREQKILMLENMYKQKIPGTEKRLLDEGHYRVLMNTLKPPKDIKEKTALVPYTNEDGITEYVNKYDADEVSEVQQRGYKAGTRFPVPKKNNIEKLKEALGTFTGAVTKPGEMVKPLPGAINKRPLGEIFK